MHEGSPELARIAGFLEKIGADIRDLAAEGFHETGPGAVFVAESWLFTFPPGAMCYLPRAHPLFAKISPEITSVVDAYDPESECITVVASATDNVYLFLAYVSDQGEGFTRANFH